jgi:hypothetical protein
MLPLLAPLLALHMPIQAAPSRLAVVPDLELGGPADTIRLERVITVRPMSGDRVAVLAYREGGTTLRIVGPGARVGQSMAFDSNLGLTHLAVSGDTIRVFSAQGTGDRLLMTLVAGTAAPIRQQHARVERGQDGALLGSLSGPGLVLVLTRGEPNGRYDRALPVPRYDIRRVPPDGDITETLLTVLDSTPKAMFELRGVRQNPIMSARAPLTVGPVFASADGVLYYAATADYQIRRLGLDGRALPPLRIAQPPAPVTAAVRDSAIQKMLAGPARTLYPDSVFTQFRRHPLPPARPFVRSLFAAPDGDLAVVRADYERFDGTPDSLFVDLISRDGVLRGQVALPPAHTLHAYDGRHLYTSVVDQDRLSGRVVEGRPVTLSRVVRHRVVFSR